MPWRPNGALRPEMSISWPAMATFIAPAALPRALRSRIRMTASGAGICARHLSFWWPDGRAGLTDVNLHIHPGELAMIVGPNGCGKSTLLRCLRGLLLPDAGDVSLERPAAYVYQNPNLQIVMPSIGADLAMSVPGGKDLPDAVLRVEVLAALRSIGLEPAEEFLRLSSHRLSGGQRQRVAVAGALAMKPKTILFDEVTASMDSENKQELVTRVRRIVTEQNLAALWVTHLLDELDVADTIIMMEAGRVVAEGPRVRMMPRIYEMQGYV